MLKMIIYITYTETKHVHYKLIPLALHGMENSKHIKLFGNTPPQSAGFWTPVLSHRLPESIYLFFSVDSLMFRVKCEDNLVF